MKSPMISCQEEKNELAYSKLFQVHFKDTIVISEFSKKSLWICKRLFLKDKVECVFPMVIWFEFRMRKCRDDNQKEDASHLTYLTIVKYFRLGKTVFIISKNKVWLFHQFWYDKNILNW